MAIAARLQDYLIRHQVQYDVLEHPRTRCSIETSHVAHVPADRLAKAVVLCDSDCQYLMVVLPSSCHIDLTSLRRDLARQVHVASEDELPQLFTDCVPGAVPPVGDAYELPVLLEDELANQPDVYFEAGDHQALVHLSGSAFRRLMETAERGRFSVRH